MCIRDRLETCVIKRKPSLLLSPVYLFTLLIAKYYLNNRTCIKFEQIFPVADMYNKVSHPRTGETPSRIRTKLALYPKTVLF